VHGQVRKFMSIKSTGLEVGITYVNYMPVNDETRIPLAARIHQFTNVSMAFGQGGRRCRVRESR
jgi:hypothetical protein